MLNTLLRYFSGTNGRGTHVEISHSKTGPGMSTNLSVVMAVRYACISSLVVCAAAIAG